MKNVLMILDSLNIGGTEMLSYDIISKFNSRDYKLHFISTKCGELSNKFKSLNRQGLFLNRKKALDLAVIKRIRQYIIDNDIQIIHTNRAIDSLYGYLASLNLNVKRIMTIHGYMDKRIDNIVLKLLFKKMDRNIIVSSSFKEIYKKKFRLTRTSNFTVLHNGIDETRLTKNLVKTPSENIKICMIGNFVSAKDHFTVCKASKILKDQGFDFQLFFAGQKNRNMPEVFDNCLNYCKKNNLIENVHFLGKVEDIGELLGDMDIMVFSTIDDSFGLAVIEGMLCGLPVVLSNTDAMNEISNNGMNALMFEKRDESDLSEKLKLLLEDREKREEIGEKGRLWAKKKYSIRTYLKNLEKIYEEV